MSDLKDKVAGYLSTFLDKELSEIAVDVRKDFLDKRLDKEAARGHSASKLIKAGATDIALKAERDAKALANLHTPRVGRNSAQRHDDSREAWKRLRATGPGGLPDPPRVSTHTAGETTAGTSATQASGTGRVSTAVTRALIAAASDKGKKDLLKKQSAAPEAGTTPNFVLANQTDTGTNSAKKYVSQEVLADLKAKAAKK
jgi:hypothetical protein